LVPTKESISKETITEKENPHNPPLLLEPETQVSATEQPSQSQPPIPPVPPAPLPDELYLEDDVCKYTMNAYRRERGIRLKLKPTELLATRARACEEKYSPEEFRVGLLNFLRSENEIVKEKGWPLGMYLADPERNMYATAAPVFNAPIHLDVPRRTTDRTPTPPNAPSGSQRDFRDPKNIACELVHTWDTIVTDHEVGNLDPLTWKMVEAAIRRHPEIVNDWREICERSKNILDIGEMKQFCFGFLFDETVADQPNWWKMIRKNKYSMFETAKSATQPAFAKSAGFAEQLRKDREAAKKAS
jgi:hypothetical protein